MNNVLKKGLVIALALSMSMSAALPAFAADKTVTTAAPVSTVIETTSSVKAKAKRYFVNYVSGNISADSFLDKVAAGEKRVVVDIRDAADYAKGHVKGAVNIPYGVAVAENLENLPTDRPVYVYCYSGQTASQTSAILRMLGYESYTLSGGTNGWKSANLPMEKRSTQEFLNKKVENYFANLPADKNNVSAAAFLEDAKTPKDCVIIDIRDKADYDKGHVRSAINVPYGVDIVEALDKIPNNKTVYVYCYSGQTASQAMAALEIMGYEVYNLSGGMNNGWLANGKTLVK